MKNKHDIRENEYIVGCRIGETIYINPNLRELKYLALRERILDHEKRHSSGLETHDLFMDLFNDELKGLKKEYWGFVLSHPKTWVSFLPFTRIDGRWSLDVGLLMIWILALGGVTLLSLIW
jgi:hypothetical protein